MSLIAKRPTPRNVRDRVCLIIAKCQRVSVADVISARSLDDIHIDSLDALNIIFSLEEEFKVPINISVNRISTIEDLFAIVEQRVGGSPGPVIGRSCQEED